MAKNKKAAKAKDKNVAKHILKAREAAAVVSATATNETSSRLPPPSAKSKKKQPNTHTKSPEEVINYLVLWDTAKESAWKFNKNTQSWLLRHMYSADHVNKKCFGLLLEYLKGVEGKGILEGVMAAAVKRCELYKKYDEDNNDDKDGDDDDGTTPQVGDKGKGGDDENNQLSKNFLALDEHDRRKVYKRARRVLDVVKDLV